MMAKGHWVSFGGNENINILELTILMGTQPCECTRNLLLYVKSINCLVCELYFDKTGKKKKSS